ncbi:DUF389 domain-containing protein [Tersicoccus sp. MR15.9]|uniref:DUF389 domain-containing protein n=1 Tax=Tersicoccus mangrovi TaxID=3121635 RepID=UPI002FE527F9
MGETDAMLSVRVSAPTDIARVVHDRLVVDETVCDVTVLPGTSLDGRGDVLLFAMARENADRVVGMLRAAGVPERGAITVIEPLTVISDAADAAERAAPGHPADGVVWAQVADRSREDARPSVNFFVFLLLATLIAGIGRLLDQPILIIGAMVVGPEFAPVAAICYAVVRRRRAVATTALATLLGGFAGCIAVAWAVWALAHAAGLFSYAQATTGPQTQFIVSPDTWSFVIAVLAGAAGMLSLTSSKPSALVGVFISITTVPAVGAIGLTLAVGAWDEARGGAVQLLVNVVGLLLAGTATLGVQLLLGRLLGTRSPGRRATARVRGPQR